jgi:hypothetical protein
MFSPGNGCILPFDKNLRTGSEGYSQTAMIPWRMPRATASARLAAFSFVMTEATWNFTVDSAIPRR